MRKLVAIVMSCALLAPACPSVPAPPDSGTDAGSSPCARACGHLAELGCAEGKEANCTTVCEHAEAARLTPMHPDCLAAAPSKDAARACRSVRCP